MKWNELTEYAKALGISFTAGMTLAQLHSAIRAKLGTGSTAPQSNNYKNLVNAGLKTLSVDNGSGTMVDVEFQANGNIADHLATAFVDESQWQQALAIVLASNPTPTPTPQPPIVTGNIVRVGYNGQDGYKVALAANVNQKFGLIQFAGFAPFIDRDASGKETLRKNSKGSIEGMANIIFFNRIKTDNGEESFSNKGTQYSVPMNTGLIKALRMNPLFQGLQLQKSELWEDKDFVPVFKQEDNRFSKGYLTNQVADDSTFQITSLDNAGMLAIEEIKLAIQNSYIDASAVKKGKMRKMVNGKREWVEYDIAHLCHTSTSETKAGETAYSVEGIGQAPDAQTVKQIVEGRMTKIEKAGAQTYATVKAEKKASRDSTIEAEDLIEAKAKQWFEESTDSKYTMIQARLDAKAYYS
jgi:hypothetical protein